MEAAKDAEKQLNLFETQQLMLNNDSRATIM